MIGFSLILPVITALLVSVSVTWLLATGKWSLIPKDVPNSRSLHETPVPRVGGIAILLAQACALGLFAWFDFHLSSLSLWLGVIPLVAIGLLDDWRQLSAISRLIVQFLSAGILLAVLEVEGLGLLNLELGYGLFALALIGTVWAINAYNFMDGMDGFAGSMSVIGFSVFAFLGFVGGYQEYSVLSAIIVAAVIGFLFFNWPRATIFLGDAGSTTLGFLSVAMGVWGIQLGIFPPWVPFLIFSPFWLDASVTLLKRAFRGERVWQPHRQHYYQRLVLAGLGHKKVLILELALMLLCSLSAILGTFLSISGQMIVVAAWVLVYVIILTAFPIFERHHSS